MRKLLMKLAVFVSSFGVAVAEEVKGAANVGDVISTINSGDTSWVLISSALVIFMTVPALALFYGGMVRKKNVISTLYYSMGSAVVVSLLWVIVQYSMAFGGKELIPGFIGGFDKMFLENISVNGVYETAKTVPIFAFIAFQLSFAIITPALISGAIVERMRFSSWLLFNVAWSILVYAPVAHWVWNPNGWLFKMGVLDFAGGYVVEVASGIGAITAVFFIGERVRFKKEAMLPSNIPLVFIGAAMLWIGWFGFNAGSALAANGIAANAFMVTNTAGAAAAIMWMLAERLINGKPSLIGAASGVVAGMVAITPAAGFVDIKASLIIGMVAGVICYLMVAKVKKILGYDDSLDVLGIHGIGGMWGLIATGLFANPAINSAGTGLFYGNSKQLTIQLIGLGAVILYVIVGTIASLLIVKIFRPLRVEPQEEIYGLDLVLHGERVTE